MKKTLDRRTFLKAAGATTGFMIAEGASVFSYAQNSKVRVGCIGVGGQGSFHISDGLANNPDIQISAIADVYRPNQQAAVLLARLSNAKIILVPGADPTEEQIQAAMATPDVAAYYDYRELLANPDVDAVVISSPLNTHAEISMAALDAGKYVFCEKTLVRSVEEGRALITKCHEKGRWVQVGHQRRYNPKYNLGMWMAHESDLIGRITHITAQWHRNQQWRRPVPKEYALNDEEKKYITDLEKHLNWRLYDDLSGGLFTELATHQTDVANWFLKAVPSRVTAMAGLDYWRDGRTAADNIGIMYEYDIKRSMPGFHAMKPRTTLMDETSANRNYTVRFLYSSILSCGKRGCAELIQGDYGSMEFTEGVCRYFPEQWVVAEEKARKKAEEEAKRRAAEGGTPDAAPVKELTAEELAKKTTSGNTRKEFGDKASLEGIEMLQDNVLKSPDSYQFEAFVECIRNGGVPLNNQMVGYTTAITALAAIEALRAGRVVQIDPAWYTFDFEVPSHCEYDSSWGRNNKQQSAAPPPAPEGEGRTVTAS